MAILAGLGRLWWLILTVIPAIHFWSHIAHNKPDATLWVADRAIRYRPSASPASPLVDALDVTQKRRGDSDPPREVPPALALSPQRRRELAARFSVATSADHRPVLYAMADGLLSWRTILRVDQGHLARGLQAAREERQSALEGLHYYDRIIAAVH